jgi:hypothetical protein
VYEPPRACYYITRIHVRVMDAGDRGFTTLSALKSLTPLSTYDASVSGAARRTLWSLSHTYWQQLHNTKYKHLPLRIRGENQTSIVPGGANEDRLNTLPCVVVGFNTDLDTATLDLSRVHWSWRMHVQGSQPCKLSLMEGIPRKFKSPLWHYPLPARGSAIENQDPSRGCFRFFKYYVVIS